MIACSFDEANCVLDKPLNMTYDQCEVLSVCKAVCPEGTPVVISCWKLTEKEKQEIAKSGRVWVVVLGDTMPPLIPTGHKPNMIINIQEGD